MNEPIAWWNQDNFPGTRLGTAPFLPTDHPIVGAGEIAKGQGKVVVTSLPGYNWGPAATNGADPQANLERYTHNVIDYLQTESPTILVIGDSTNLIDMPLAEQNAYNWARMQFGAEAIYQSLTEVATNGVPMGIEAVWYHSETSAMPASLTAAAPALDSFINNGGGMFLSGYATQAINVIDSTIDGPSEVIGGPRNADAAMGLRPYLNAEDHPIFEGLTESTFPDPNWGGYRFIADGQPMQEPIAWWQTGTFPGTRLGTVPFLPNNVAIVGAGEIPKGLGTVIVTAVPGYNWGPAQTNGAVEQANLEQYTHNALEYVRYQEPRLLLVADAPYTGELGERVRNGYDWAIAHFNGEIRYMSFEKVATLGIPASVESMWYYLEDSSALPASASAAAGVIESYVDNGGGLLLTGFAPQMVGTINAGIAPTEIIDNPRNADPAMGIRQVTGTETHPIFAGLPASGWPDPNWTGFRTVADTIAMKEAIAWWNQNNFPGIALGTAPFLNPDGSITGVGEIGKNNGAVMVASLPGYSWATGNPDSSQSNLELFTENMLTYLGGIEAPQTLMATVQGGSSPIIEGSEDGVVIEVSVVNVLFKPSFVDSLWVVENLPEGIDYTLARVSDEVATLTLSGTAADYDTVINNFTIQVPASQFVNLRADMLMSMGEVVFEGQTEAGIDEKNGLSWSVYPNPANNEVSLRLDLEQASRVDVSFLDLNGKEVMAFDLGMQQAGSQVHRLDLHELAAGLYLIVVNTEKGILHGKLVVEK